KRYLQLRKEFLELRKSLRWQALTPVQQTYETCTVSGLLTYNSPYTGQSLEEGAGMADQDWLRTLLEKIDQDRRESEARVERGIQRIEHIIERIADGLESTRKEIQAQNERVNTRIDQVYVHFQQSTVQARWATLGLIATVIIGFVGLIVSVVLTRP